MADYIIKNFRTVGLETKAAKWFKPLVAHAIGIEKESL